MLAIDFGLNGLPRSLAKPCAANSAEIDLSVNPCPFYVMTPKWPIGGDAPDALVAHQAKLVIMRPRLSAAT